MLRDAGIDAPILCCPQAAARRARRRSSPLDLEATVYTAAGVEALAAAAAAGRRRRARAGAPQGRHRHAPRRRRSPTTPCALAKAIDDAPGLELGVGVDPLRGGRRARQPVHRRAARPLRRRRSPSSTAAGIEPPLRHAANSAAAIDHPTARLDLVRCGIAVYGIAPGPGARRPPAAAPGAVAAWPRSRSSSGWRPARRSPTGCATASTATARSPPCRSATPTACRAGSGADRRRGARRRPAPADRRHGHHGPAHGRLRRRRRRGRATRSCSSARQGDEPITADDWAGRLDTIGYEIVCGIGPRVPRRYRRDPDLTDAGRRHLQERPWTAARSSAHRSAPPAGGRRRGRTARRREAARRRRGRGPRRRRSPTRCSTCPDDVTPSHRRRPPTAATLHAVERGDGPAARPAPRHHAARRRVGAAAPPARPTGYRVIAVDLRGHGGSTAGADGLRHAAAWPTTSPPCSRRSTSATPSWSATRWAA